jgi:ParB family transcriptional regulator, chromosome partitioning protein
VGLMSTAPFEVDLHLLDQRFADARLVDPRAVERLASSIARDGQLVPCIAVGAV